MLHRKYFVISAALIYIILVTLFFNLQRQSRYQFDLTCYFEKHCVSFCCKDEKICDQNYIDKSFDETALRFDDRLARSRGVQPIFSKPSCRLKEVNSEAKWNFYLGGAVEISGLYYRNDDYCFENFESNNKVQWKLFICASNESLHKALHFVFYAISILALIITIVVFIYVKEIRVTVHGKTVLCLLTAVLITYITFPLSYHKWIPNIQMFTRFTMVIGLLSSFLWTTVLSFDVWWTIRNFQRNVPCSNEKLFKFYCAYFFGFIFLLMTMTVAGTFFLPYYFRNFSLFFMFTCFFLTAVADIVFLILTALRVVKMIRSRTFSQNSQFQLEKERFWNNLELHAILLITYPVEILSFVSMDESFNAFIIADIVKCFSALLIFTTLVAKNDIKTSLLLQYANV